MLHPPPDPQMKRDALAGAPDFISKHQPNKDSAAEKKTQPEIAFSAAFRAALARKAVAA
jgi:hypothetical protein